MTIKLLNNFLYDFVTAGSIAQYVLICLLVVGVCTFVCVLSRRVILSIITSCLGLLSLIILGVFDTGTSINYLYITILLVFIGFLIILFFANLGKLREYLIFKKKDAPAEIKKVQAGNVKIYNKEELYNVITDTVSSFSRRKTGAIITFQRIDDLKTLMKNGVVLNCDVSKELLQTIFYPGTRLHDGAVIIKDGKIIAASVYYTLTTKPLNGKYGSRHRAAIGISEITDSVTVVVSEETGRISIAQAGEIEPVSIDNFAHAFADAMEN